MASFKQLAEQSFMELDQVFKVYLRYLRMASAFDPDFLADEHVLARSLLVNGGPPAAMLGWSNDDFMIISNNERGAPANAAYTQMRILTGADGRRSLTQKYFTSDLAELSRVERSTEYRPTTREWYQGALNANHEPFLTKPYRIGSNPNYAVALSMTLPHAATVLAVTFDVEDVEQLLARLELSANGLAVLIDSDGQLLAAHRKGPSWASIRHSMQQLGSVYDPENSVIAEMLASFGADPTNAIKASEIRDRRHVLALRHIEPATGARYRLLMAAPIDDFTGPIGRAKQETWILAFGAILLVFPISWLGTRSVSRALDQLVHDSQRIEQLDFTPPKQAISTSVREVHMLANAYQVMRTSLEHRSQALQQTNTQLERLIKMGIRLVAERDRQSLLDAIVRGAGEATGSGSALIFLRDQDDVLRPAASIGKLNLADIPSHDLNAPDAASRALAAHTVLTGQSTIIDDFVTDLSPAMRRFHEPGAADGLAIWTLLSAPLRAPDDQVIGAIQLFNGTDPVSGRIVPFGKDSVSLVHAFAAQAGVALDNFRLIESQRAIMDSLVLMLAKAVDAKSPHTGNHCQRVPELAMMLAQAAHDCEEGPLAGFRFERPEQWHEFRVGAWLHDCGKLVTPEHVIDKATKLETVHNRIHEIRTRFEVLLRDSQIAALETVIAGQAESDEAQLQHARRAKKLHDDFAFVAQCNIGGEDIAQSHVDRLREIAAQRWRRHFDDQLGLSIAEHKRREQGPQTPLPAEEALIADKSWHIVPRDPGEWERLNAEFNMDVPRHRYNNGELHNLEIARGTLCNEERFKINEHVIETIRMLEGIPFPKELRRVPEYAGTHHETLNGTGYPRRLAGEQLSIPARIMTIVDIFEALTAADRPYRKAKTLSEAVGILNTMKVKGQIDPDLFDLFVEAGVYMQYAERYLPPSQIDAVDLIARAISGAPKASVVS